MKILFRTDIHASQYSSILRSRGEKYSTRLEGVIKSINWSERLAEKYNCDKIVDGGDFWDRPEVNAEELSALQEIKWSNIPHTQIIGNHEMGINSLEISSAHVFKLCSETEVIEKATSEIIDDIELCYLPYVLEINRKPLIDYFGEKTTAKRIIFSHNDIKGIQMGAFLSKEGFEIEEIENNCDYFFNGHLHNGVAITEKIINLGNLCGQNFSEDATRYSHNVMIIDTDSMTYELIENPYAFNFYKLNNILPTTDLKLKTNAVVTCTCASDKYSGVKELINNDSNIIVSRILIERAPTVNSEEDNKIVQLQATDHLLQFKKYVQENIGNSDIILSELAEVTR